VNYFTVEPEVAGGLGPETVMDMAVFPPKVEVLDYSFSGWLGDAIVESFPCFIVTMELTEKISASDLTGYTLDDTTVSFSDSIDDEVAKKIPSWKWLKVTGAAKVDDIGLTEDFILVLSEKALEIFKKYSMSNATISELN
jgi:hypothetical protein